MSSFIVILPLMLIYSQVVYNYDIDWLISFQITHETANTYFQCGLFYLEDVLYMPIHRRALRKDGGNERK